ncbi:flagella synthesis protein FlgN [Pseudoteredinibacter isoporae]|uniref:Flagella synthesis protein FlgN n=1 Tax=Pseudoteredinibacter isoporae TaxID=570281 RepID=A0A7X0MYW4_9GAMM|nr:flagellar protein FlgN [Pseudoteredinibacter isoporae]MBB6523504.1 flagella synthesis protein FlgN [Pseudoteredinibacter isoporae]NHO89013.1 flagellar protein FlgN [Pseudoteredinibacter isoporae]NIB24279.1 flagellar protein FlgN [Pseudoteredinibacter isoporae]
MSNPLARENQNKRAASASTLAIADLVDQDLTSSLALLHLLEKEQEALQERDHEYLRELLEEKTSLLNTLDAGSVQRAEILRELQQPNDQYAWESLIDAMGDADLKDHWQSLKDTIAQCQQLNEINGKIIARSQQTVQSLMQLLRGQDANQNLYTASGQTNSSGSINSSAIQA